MTASNARALTVVVDARLVSGEWGGVESVVSGLASGLSELDGPERYLFLTLRDRDDWIRPLLRGAAEAVPVSAGLGATSRPLRRQLKRMLPSLARIWGSRPSLGRLEPGPPDLDETLARLGADVVHLPLQAGFLANLPSIYHPHDLQHLHLPQFFTPTQIRWRERWYRTLASRAAMVAVASAWVKEDVERAYLIPRDRVRVVPWAPPTAAFTRVELPTSIHARLPDRFILYPAQTWPHKNHLGLIEGLHELRSQGLTIPVVFTGQPNEFQGRIRQRIREFGMDGQVVWLGFVAGQYLPAIYRRATAVVIPTKFEAASGPLWEAFEAGVPAACSNVTSLPEQAGDAALIFDPDRPSEIARAVRRLWAEPDLRATLAERGRRRVGSLSWARTAMIFRAHYRRLAGRPLDDTDSDLLSQPAYP